MKLDAKHLFGAVMFWTVTTTLFAWLPIVRIVGRAEGYEWGVLGLRGSGTDGPFWIFVFLTVYAVTMMFAAFRGPRRLFQPMLVLWHLAFTAIVIAGTALGGASASFQGQGLHWSFPLWLVSVPCIAFTATVIAWVVLDRRSGQPPVREPWTRTNSRRLVTSILLLAGALVLFRAGTNYNWVTALAIVFTISHWIAMVRAFEPVARSSRPAATASPRGAGSHGNEPPLRRDDSDGPGTMQRFDDAAVPATG